MLDRAYTGCSTLHPFVSQGSAPGPLEASTSRPMTILLPVTHLRNGPAKESREGFWEDLYIR